MDHDKDTNEMSEDSVISFGRPVGGIEASACGARAACGTCRRETPVEVSGAAGNTRRRWPDTRPCTTRTGAATTSSTRRNA